MEVFVEVDRSLSELALNDRSLDLIAHLRPQLACHVLEVLEVCLGLELILQFFQQRVIGLLADHVKCVDLKLVDFKIY